MLKRCNLRRSSKFSRRWIYSQSSSPPPLDLRYLGNNSICDSRFLQVPPAFIRFRGATIYFKHRRIRDAFASEQDVGEMHRSTTEAHEQIAAWCLKVLGEKLPDIGLTRLKMMDLAQLNEVATDMSPELRYAIVHWATHVRLSNNDSNGMLDRFVDVFASKTQGDVLSPNLHTW
jgi:hypothetical protein